MEHNDGGPAFARSGNNSAYGRQEGMTLRDYFAAKAMEAIISSQTAEGLIIGPVTPNDNGRVSIIAFSMADAMLKARSQP